MRADSTAALMLIVVAAGSAPATGLQSPTPSRLEILDVVFEPLGEGKNVLRARVSNPTANDLILAVDLGSKSPDYGNLGWGDTFYERVPAGATKTLRLLCRIHGPVTERTRVWMRSHSLRSRDEYDYETPDAVQRFGVAELPLRRAEDSEPIALTSNRGRAVIAAFERLQGLLRAEQYRDAWTTLTPDHRRLGFKQETHSISSMRSLGTWFAFAWSRDEFLELRPTSLHRRPDDVWTLTALRGDERWTVELVQREGTWQVDWITGVPLALRWQHWKDRLPGEMERRRTEHLEIYYEPDSTAAREIEAIAATRERGYLEISKLIGSTAHPQVRLFLFEDPRSKWLATGHRGAGLATGATLVEVYNETTKLDPYHELTHILMGPFGTPPAVFNEGFAVYVSERLGARALEHLGGGHSSLDQRSRDVLENGDWIPLPELLSYTEIGSARSRPTIAYPQAGSFVKFLVERYGLDAFLEAYRTLRNPGDETDQHENRRRLREITQSPLTDLEAAWIESLPGD
ncbi:MAG: hypothetical protein ACYS0D_06515 [Planctomycetota bacterium]|jgi:hypothetical protein